MTIFYIKFSPADQPLEFAERPVPFEGFNTKADSAKNGKPYWVEAQRQGFEPFNSTAQVRTGPVLEASPPVIRFTIRPKTPAERAAERQDQVRGHVNPAILALAKHAGLTRPQLEALIDVEIPT